MLPDETSAAQPAVASKSGLLTMLHRAIEDQLPDLQRGIEVLIWRLHTGRTREAVSALAEEVLQEVVKRAWTRPEGYDPQRGSPHAWLLGIAANVLQEQRRKYQRDQRYLIPESVLPASADVLTLSNQLLADTYDVATTQQERLIDLLDLVSPADRKILRLAYVDNLRGPELAAALGIKEGAARVRLSRAHARFAAAYHRARQAETEE